MKLKYIFLDSALDLWSPGHFELGFFASRIRRSEMECSALGFSYVRWKPRNEQLAKMGSFHQSKRSDNKWYTVEVRWGFFFLRIWLILFIPEGGCKYAHTNSYNSTMTVIAQVIMSQLELGPPMVHWALSRTTRVLVLVRAKCCALETCGEKNVSSAFRLGLIYILLVLCDIRVCRCSTFDFLNVLMILGLYVYKFSAAFISVFIA